VAEVQGADTWGPNPHLGDLMTFRRFLGLHTAAPRPPQADPAETETVRRIVARLESMPPERARLLAGMAYVLARAANADYEISDVETATMERVLVEDAGIDEAQAVLVVEMAKLQARSAGETEDYLVTREFRQAATVEQRLAVLRACYAVGAADESISSTESATLDQIANEFDLDAGQVRTVRAEFADRILARQLLERRLRG
jgi:uncharacterized tellurite resistance protein B-like protein